MNFSSQMQLCKLASVSDTYKRFVAGGKDVPAKKTFLKWVEKGTKFATLAGAGECFFGFCN
jgi:hypothetical protein